jgi:putative ABC transport system ATP-binding protein
MIANTSCGGSYMSETVLSLSNVGYKTEDSFILKGMTFDIEEGEKVLITGPSGSGKSTLLKMIASILTPTEGTIHYQGTSIEEMEPTDYRKEVSYFFQNAQLFDETVRDNLAFPYSIREESFSEQTAMNYLEQVKLPSSYLDKPIKELSGGERQRIALVRNLLFKPKVLLLDEVTSSLDANNREIILEMIGRLNKEEKATVLMISHDQEQIEEADRVIRIVDGRLEETA